MLVFKMKMALESLGGDGGLSAAAADFTNSQNSSKFRRFCGVYVTPSAQVSLKALRMPSFLCIHAYTRREIPSGFSPIAFFFKKKRISSAIASAASWRSFQPGQLPLESVRRFAATSRMSSAALCCAAVLFLLLEAVPFMAWEWIASYKNLSVPKSDASARPAK